MIILWTAVAFASGSLMFSYWLGLLVKRDVRAVGDGNPGAMNLWRAAGYPLGLAGIALDFAKGYVPVVWLTHSGMLTADYETVLVAVAPVFGHAFSPFLRGNGGKGIAVTFGVWSGLTRFTASLAYAVILAVLLLAARRLNKGKPTSSAADGIQVVLGMLLLSAFLYAGGYSHVALWCCIVNFLLLAYTHRRELASFVRRAHRKKTMENH